MQEVQFESQSYYATFLRCTSVVLLGYRQNLTNITQYCLKVQVGNKFIVSNSSKAYLPVLKLCAPNLVIMISAHACVSQIYAPNNFTLQRTSNINYFF